MNKNINFKILMEMVEQEVENYSADSSLPEKKPDHEGRMAKSEVRNLITNSLKLYKLIDREGELPGWVSAYITLSNDYINSVTQHMVEEKAADEENESSTIE